MIFRIGQRVKKVRDRLPSDPYYSSFGYHLPMGCEGTVAGYSHDGEVQVWVDGHSEPNPDRPWEFAPGQLAPLTDPKADAFIESVKKWKPEPVVPLPAKVKA